LRKAWKGLSGVDLVREVRGCYERKALNYSWVEKEISETIGLERTHGARNEKAKV